MHLPAKPGAPRQSLGETGAVPEFLSPALLAWRDRAERLATDELIPLREDPTLGSNLRRDGVRAASKRAGVHALTQGEFADGPHQGEGAAEPALRLLVVREALARHGVGQVRGVFGAAPGVLAGVGEPLRSTHLLPLLAGDKRSGFAFTEPVDAPRPSWARVEGNDLIINGQKSYVTGGAELNEAGVAVVAVDFLTATVDIEGEGPAMVVIDTDLPGVQLERRFASFDGSQHGAFRLREVRVPRHCALGRPGEGRGRALQRISEVRQAIAADCVGTAIWLLDLLTDHLQRERRDGRRPGDQERVRLRYGELRVQAYAARSMVYRTARLVDAGQPTVNECIAAKLFASEVANHIADCAVQLIGGEALIEGHPVEQIYRRLRTLRLAEGESDVLRINVARGRLDLDQGRI